MTKVIEVFSSMREDKGSHDEVVQNLVNLGWVVIEEPEGRTVLQHDLIPGSLRIVTQL